MTVVVAAGGLGQLDRVFTNPTLQRRSFKVTRHRSPSAAWFQPKTVLTVCDYLTCSLQARLRASFSYVKLEENCFNVVCRYIWR